MLRGSVTKWWHLNGFYHVAHDYPYKIKQFPNYYPGFEKNRCGPHKRGNCGRPDIMWSTFGRPYLFYIRLTRPPQLFRGAFVNSSPQIKSRQRTMYSWWCYGNLKKNVACHGFPHSNIYYTKRSAKGRNGAIQGGRSTKLLSVSNHGQLTSC